MQRGYVMRRAQLMLYDGSARPLEDWHNRSVGIATEGRRDVTVIKDGVKAIEARLALLDILQRTRRSTQQAPYIIHTSYNMQHAT